MPMGVGIGGRPVFNSVVTDKRTGQQTTVQGTSMGDVMRGAADASARWGNVPGGGGGGQNVGGVSNVAPGSARVWGNGITGGYVPGLGTVGVKGAGGASGASNALFNARTANNGFSAGYGNDTVLGRNAKGLPPTGAPALQAMGGASNINSLIQQQLQNNSAAANENRNNVKGAQDGLRKVGTDYDQNNITALTRNRVTELLNNPDSITDDMANTMRNRNENQVRAQQDNLIKDQEGILSASGNLDAGSMLALRENAARAGTAQMQSANQDLDIARAQMRNQDRLNAINTGQRQGAQDVGVGLDVNKTILQNLPQVAPDDLSGLIATLYNGGGGAGGGGAGGAGVWGSGGGGGGAMSNFEAEFGNSGGFNFAKGYHGAGPSTFAGFDSMFDTRAADQYDRETYTARKEAENRRNAESWDRFAAGSWASTGGGKPRETQEQMLGRMFGV